MTARPESDFPTIRDFRDRLSELVDSGLGDLPVQIMIVPDSTIQAVANFCDPARVPGVVPALMIELPNDVGGRRMPVSLISTARMTGNAMPSGRRQ